MRIPDRFWFDLERIGPNPFLTVTVERYLGEEGWFDAHYVSQIVLHARSMIDLFYRRIAAAQQRAANVSHFAEKQAIPYYSWLTWELYPGAREIFLVRDFRDVYCSILAFNRKRGVTVFGRENVDIDEAYAGWLGERIVDLQHNWEARADRALLVRYEDLIRSPDAEMTRVLDYLGLDSSVTTVRALLARANARMVSYSSIARSATGCSPSGAGGEISHRRSRQ
ncbi:MAG: sulfotransferase [Anaerolineae bacterium]|nr:sulfotransferase [Anaerolineae bacterium]